MVEEACKTHKKVEKFPYIYIVCYSWKEETTLDDIDVNGDIEI
jgi:hypothetical protein